MERRSDRHSIKIILIILENRLGEYIMLGVIIGDLARTCRKRNKHEAGDASLLSYECVYTQQTVGMLAVCKAISDCENNNRKLETLVLKYRKKAEQIYPEWVFEKENLSQFCACGFASRSLEHAKMMARTVAGVENSRLEYIQTAEIISGIVFLAKTGRNMLEIRDYISGTYGLTEQKCPMLQTFFLSQDYVDAVRKGIALGENNEKVAAVVGGIAEAYYGIPASLRKYGLTFLDEKMLSVLLEFENQFNPKLEQIQPSASVSVPLKRKIKTGERTRMMQSAMNSIDEELKISSPSPEKTTSQKLFLHLFEACNILRGPINQDEFKSYVTPILFYKRLSDVYDEETEAALAISGGDEEFARFPENHRFIIPDSCHWKEVREQSENVGTAIVMAMNGIERANPDTLNGVFSSFDDANWTDKTKLSDERLKDLIEHMSKIKVGNHNYSADVMGDSYEFLIKKFADMSKKNAGEFYTPRSIVKLLVMLLDPKIGESVYDPACGTGGMLIEAIRYMKSDKLTYGKIYGQEKNLATSAIARMNLFLHGAQDFVVTQGDTLRSPNYLDEGQLKTFDCVIANPPFSLKSWGADQFVSDCFGRNIWGCPTDSNGDFAWLQHMVKSMDSKQGRCAVVLPQGVLFRSGKEGEIRKQLVESDKLECIIALTGGIFYSTGVSACILLLNNKKKNSHKGQVCMIDASGIYTPQRAQNIMTQADVERVYHYYIDYEDVVEKVKVVTLDDIRKKEYTLAVNNYVEKKEQEMISPQKVKRQYFEALDRVQKAEERMRRLLLERGYVNE